MDPYVSTLIKQGLALGVAVGLLMAGLYFVVQYQKLQHATSLNMIPGQLP